MGQEALIADVRNSTGCVVAAELALIVAKWNFPITYKPTKICRLLRDEWAGHKDRTIMEND